MKKSVLLNRLTTLLSDSADRFKPLELDQFLDTAAVELGRVKPLIVSASLTLVADESFYDPPGDMVRPIILDWGSRELITRKPWEPDWPGRLPRLSSLTTGEGRKLMLAPAPSAQQISLLGATAPYRYQAHYTIADDEAGTNIPDDAAPLLLVRALAEAMLALAARGIAKPVTLGGRAAVSVPKNGTPAALAQQLMDHFEGLAR